MKITREQVVEFSDNAIRAGFRAFPVREEIKLVPKKCKNKHTKDCAALCICPDKRLRKCLGHECDTEFLSNDKSHRMCSRCLDPYMGISFESYAVAISRKRGTYE